MKHHDMICIVCPMGCRLQVSTQDDDSIVAVQGNQCPRGDIYARQELTHPKRILTTTVKISGALYPRLPVITTQDIPKGHLFEVMQALANIEVKAPVTINQVILPNVCGLGVDVVASRSMDAIQV